MKSIKHTVTWCQCTAPISFGSNLYPGSWYQYQKLEVPGGIHNMQCFCIFLLNGCFSVDILPFAPLWYLWGNSQLCSSEASTYIRGDVRILWLHPLILQPAAANMYRKSYTSLLNAAGFWLQQAAMDFDVFPYDLTLQSYQIPRREYIS